MTNKHSASTKVLDCRVDLADKDYALEASKKAIDEKRNFHIITINPEMIMNAQKNKDFFEILNGSDLNIIDGVGVSLALRLKNISKKPVRGVDFSRALVRLASENGYRIGFLGAKEEVVTKACENFKKEYKNLDVCYLHNGYFKSLDEIKDDIVKSEPQILLVAMGSPKQEEIIVELKKSLQGCVMIGVGGSFDVFSGLVEESPEIYRKLGLEWLYRTIKQPERFKRIFPLLPMFLIKCIIDIVLKKG